MNCKRSAYVPARTVGAARLRKRNRACVRISADGRVVFSDHMHRVVCGARNCAHNMSGLCNAGVLHIQEEIFGGNMPYCATVSLENDFKNVAEDCFPKRFWEKPNLSCHNTIACAMIQCVYNNRQGLCESEKLCMIAPHPAESRFAICGCYCKRS